MRVFWSEWAETLRRRGLDGFAAWFLEAAGPLNILGAQLLYIGKPMLGSNWDERIQAAARLLEDDEESQAFIEYLKGQTP